MGLLASSLGWKWENPPSYQKFSLSDGAGREKGSAGQSRFVGKAEIRAAFVGHRSGGGTGVGESIGWACDGVANTSITTCGFGLVRPLGALLQREGVQQALVLGVLCKSHLEPCCIVCQEHSVDASLDQVSLTCRAVFYRSDPKAFDYFNEMKLNFAADALPDASCCLFLGEEGIRRCIIKGKHGIVSMAADLL